MPPPVSATQNRPLRGEGGLAAEASRRRSMRVLLSVPVLVTGKTADKKDFAEETRTLVVNAHGALIALAARIAPGQQISIQHKATDATIPCRVAYVGAAQGGKPQVGIEFLKPSPSFWRIDFPPDDWVVPES